jgi:hypothetical protein
MTLTLLIILAGLLFFGMGMAHAQTLPEPPTDLVAAGASLNTFSSPPISGNVAYAHRLSGGTYSYTVVDMTSKLSSPFTLQTSTSTGVAQYLMTFGPARVYALGTAGIAAGGTNTGVVITGGTAIIIPIGKTSYSLIPSLRVLKSSIFDRQEVYGLALGFGK